MEFLVLSLQKMTDKIFLQRGITAVLSHSMLLMDTMTRYGSHQSSNASLIKIVNLLKNFQLATSGLLRPVSLNTMFLHGIMMTLSQVKESINSKMHWSKPSETNA